MPKRRERARDDAGSRGRTGQVRKLSPQTPAARDEGPRLIPLGPIKDFGLARIEHYLELADKALGRIPLKAPESAAQQPLPPPPEVELEVASAPEILLPEPASPRQPLVPPLPRRLKFPKPPQPLRPPKRPKLSAPKPPRSRFPKLAVPKPPRRGDHSA
jgi:outer membrane biosynthesis protein TonB